MSFTITEILQKAKEIIETNKEIGGFIQIKGEVGTFKIFGKHAYLNLKDENSTLKCVYFMVPQVISTTIGEGSIVEAYGYLSIYETRGDFQFYIKSMREISKAGLLMLEYERIKHSLISEKIIPKSPEDKKVLPKFPQIIGIITSINGAAIQDVIKTIKNRYPECTVHIFHTGVQGKVEHRIAETIRMANRSKVDLLLLVRGGGSIEDLWCFNHPIVVRAVRKSQKPIIVGVGHETDHTLCEYAADYIGSTPTSAAIIATPDMKTLIESKNSEMEKILLLIKQKKAKKESELSQLIKKINDLDPKALISKGLSEFNVLLEQISTSINKKITERKNQLNLLQKSLQNPSALLKFKKLETILIVNTEKIKSNDPKRYLNKGFVRIEKHGNIVNSVVQLKKGDSVEIYLKDGNARSKIIELSKVKE